MIWPLAFIGATILGLSVASTASDVRPWNALSNAMLSFIENPEQIHLMRPTCIQRINQLYRTELIWEALLNKYKELEYISK